MTVQQLIDAIKREVHVDGNNELDQVILDLINEILPDYTARAFYPELLVLDKELTVGADGLLDSPPSDIQHFLKKTVRYAELGQSPRSIRPMKKYVAPDDGVPRVFTRTAAGFRILPYNSISAGAKVLFDYYQRPATLALDDEFPVPALESTVKKEAMARVSTFSDPKQYQKYKSEAGQSYVSATAQNQNG